MPVQFTATLIGHPWDLWGLAKLFDGKNTDHTVIEANEPRGLPSYNFSNKDERDRFQKLGYDVFAKLTNDTLIWRDEDGPPDIKKMKIIAEDVVARLNGIGRVLEPDHWPVRLYHIAYTAPYGSGGGTLGTQTPNKQYTGLGRHPSQFVFAENVFELSRQHPAVRFVLDAIAMRPTWVSLYLVFEAIRDNVGGQRALEQKEFVTKQDLKDFGYAAQHNRSLSEGMRHSSTISALPKPPIALVHAHGIINVLTMRWLESLK
jgi:hypothetical protein